VTTVDLVLRRRTDRQPQVKPCALCGEPIRYVAVHDDRPKAGARPRRVSSEIVRTDTEPTGAALQFRALVDLDGVVWVPAKDAHVDPRTCPDPPPETAAFWEHDARRESYKAERRERARLRRRQEAW
jgi:hypothetical protein